MSCRFVTTCTALAVYLLLLNTGVKSYRVRVWRGDDVYSPKHTLCLSTYRRCCLEDIGHAYYEEGITKRYSPLYVSHRLVPLPSRMS